MLSRHRKRLDSLRRKRGFRHHEHSGDRAYSSPSVIRSDSLPQDRLPPDFSSAPLSTSDEVEIGALQERFVRLINQKIWPHFHQARIGPIHHAGIVGLSVFSSALLSEHLWWGRQSGSFKRGQSSWTFWRSGPISTRADQSRFLIGGYSVSRFHKCSFEHFWWGWPTDPF